MKIVLPLPPNMANSRMHWKAKSRKQQEYMESCGTAVNMTDGGNDGWLFGSRGISPFGFSDVDLDGDEIVIADPTAITATIYHTHTMDQDNAMARLKWPVDWLKDHGLIVDDDPDHLVWTGVPTQVKCKKAERRVEFELQPLVPTEAPR